jgi:predicted TIM-barrel fold metal-dependent hydrolase
MITIDVHAHLVSSKHLDPENPIDVGFLESMSGLSIGEDFPVELLLSEMDKGGIQMTVIQGHAPNSGVLSANDELAAIVREHPDRLAAFAGVNPFEGKKAAEELERCVKELGFKGCGEFGYMDLLDKRCFPIYEKCIELDVPILIHTGFTNPTAPLKYGSPVPLDEVAMMYPDLKIIAAHCGFPWYMELASVVGRRPNVYVDVSALGVAAMPDLIRMQVIFPFLNLGTERVLFGSDFPVVRPSQYAPYVRKLRPNLVMRRLVGLPRLTQADTDKIMGGNAARLLKLDTTGATK